MVLAGELTPGALIDALEAGRFYGTSGVQLKKVVSSERGLSVEVDAEPGVEYAIEFIGTRAGYDAHHEPVTFTLPGKKDVSWEVCIDTRYESGAPDEPVSQSSGEELECIERSMCVLRLVKGSQEEARHASWKHPQRGKPSPPPRPATPSRHEPIDPTTAAVRQKRKDVVNPKISELTQGAPEADTEPPVL